MRDPKLYRVRIRFVHGNYSQNYFHQEQVQNYYKLGTMLLNRDEPPSSIDDKLQIYVDEEWYSSMSFEKK